MSDFKKEFDELDQLSNVSNNTPIKKKQEKKEAFVSSSEEDELDSLETLVKSEPVKVKPLFDKKQVEGIEKELKKKTVKAVVLVKKMATALNEASQGFREGVALYFDTWKKVLSVLTANAFKKKTKEDSDTTWDDMIPSDPVKVPQKRNLTDSYGDVPLTDPKMEVLEKEFPDEAFPETQSGGFPVDTKRINKIGWVVLVVILLFVLFVTLSKLPLSLMEPMATVQELEAVSDDMNKEEVPVSKLLKQEPVAVPLVDTVKQTELENPQLKSESVFVKEPKASTPPVRQENKRAEVIKSTTIKTDLILSLIHI